MQMDSPENITGEKRAAQRSTDLTTHRVEIKLVGRPIYQFKVKDVSSDGAGILIKANSNFLNMIEVNQVLDVIFIPSKGSDPSGMYRAEIKHITNVADGRFKGHRLVGVSILKGSEQTATVNDNVPQPLTGRVHME